MSVIRRRTPCADIMQSQYTGWLKIIPLLEDVDVFIDESAVHQTVSSTLTRIDTGKMKVSLKYIRLVYVPINLFAALRSGSF